MKRNLIVFFLALATCFCSASTSFAGEKDMLLCLPGFPGTQTQAQPYLDKMLRFLENQLGWEAGSITGKYYSDGAKAGDALTEKKPGFALVGPSIYARYHKTMGMRVIAKVEANGRGESIYSIITRKDGPKTVAELTGKKLAGTILHDPQFVHNVLLDGAIPAGKIELIQEQRPLKALRNVARGKMDAAIVDESVLEHLSELPFANDVQIIYKTNPVPAPAVVVMGDGAKNKAKLKKVLLGLCSQPDGNDLCKTLTISSIRDAADADYKMLIKKYSR
jgi:ABC-type phosphate/phosphonate transport system substrate-binding protein